MELAGRFDDQGVSLRFGFRAGWTGRVAAPAPGFNAPGLPGGFLRSPLLPGPRPASMPPACPGDSYARRYCRDRARLQCPRLARGILTLAATAGTAPGFNAPGLPGGFLRSSLLPGPSPASMPPACPGDSYACRYCRDRARLQCPRLARGILTLAATAGTEPAFNGPGLPGGSYACRYCRDSNT